MTSTGMVRNGAVVLDPGVELPEGVEVRVGVAPAGIEGVEGLLEEPTLDEALEECYLLYKIRRGIQQADAGQTVSHEEARERLEKWLT